MQNYFNRFYLGRRKEEKAVKTSVEDLSIKVHDPRQIISSLSGGNQQKVVVAKGLLTAPKVLMLDEPSRGIDVAAKSEIFAIMANLAEQGYGVIFISSELKEVLAMADRILVMSKGASPGNSPRGSHGESWWPRRRLATGRSAQLKSKRVSYSSARRREAIMSQASEPLPPSQNSLPGPMSSSFCYAAGHLLR